jgi:hypothetical protein
VYSELKVLEISMLEINPCPVVDRSLAQHKLEATSSPSNLNLIKVSSTLDPIQVLQRPKRTTQKLTCPT